MIKNFFTCGIVGWCLEILFTALHTFQKQDYKLKGNTSLWMFPIYGLATLLAPLSIALNKKPVFLRGCVYTFFIFLTEFITGKLLKKHDLCPWNYETSKYNIQGTRSKCWNTVCWPWRSSVLWWLAALLQLYQKSDWHRN